MDDPNPIMGIIIILVLSTLEAVFLAMKIALYAFSEGTIKKTECSEEKEKQLRKILINQKSYLGSLEFISGFLMILIGMIYFKDVIQNLNQFILQKGVFLGMNWLNSLCYFILTFLVVMIFTLFGIVLPSKISQKYGYKVIYYFAGLFIMIGWILRPIGWIINLSLNLILLPFGMTPSELEENVTEEEFITMVNEGHEQGVFDAIEVEMISNIIQLDEKEARDIMTNKRKIIAIQNNTTLIDAIKFMIKENYSRYPLYEDNRDNIIGILHLKDVINAYISSENNKISLNNLAREPYFVPTTQNVNILFHDMQSKGIHLAIVIDEYGQTAGLVAMEDFLEEIVGNIRDEYDEEEKLVLSKNGSTAIVQGAIRLEELAQELDIFIEHEDFDTLNGLLISLLDRIPGDGETAILSYHGYQFNILETKNNMIERVVITKEEIELDETKKKVIDNIINI